MKSVISSNGSPKERQTHYLLVLPFFVGIRPNESYETAWKSSKTTLTELRNTTALKDCFISRMDWLFPLNNDIMASQSLFFKFLHYMETNKINQPY